MPKQILVPFHGSTLILVDHNNEPFIPLKSIVEGMGLNWSHHLRNLNHSSSQWGIANVSVPSIDKRHQTPCIPLRRLFAWLQTLRTKWLSPTMQSNVVLYQKECDEVLWKYWSFNQPTPMASGSSTSKTRMLICFENNKILSSHIVSNNAVIY